ncbi:hypothetical protein GCM10010103_61800 [Streptomyces paradoxus]|uniref:Uncharacterized protein n=1 Tax=Streptomyces paradoxus TaxID=66375 RepID=A0A7W9TI78_9ACTN|nr:hypothetical protein [Streptomyces paradoxus]MBB6081220.1 hypothetical protein [Streptomyces paradoxus]
MHRFPLEPDRATMTEMGRLVLDRVVDRTDKLAARPASSPLSPQPRPAWWSLSWRPRPPGAAT